MSNETSSSVFQAPSAFEAFLNRAFGFLVGLGIGPKYIYLLQVRGRKSGRIFSTPVDLIEIEGTKYLVGPRGRTQWARNAEAAGEVTLKKGSDSRKYRVTPIADSEKPPKLKLYLDSYSGAVKRFFPVPPGSPVEAFRDIAQNYPVFALNAM
jgi:F420H(2)-dependent quinone reductase